MKNEYYVFGEIVVILLPRKNKTPLPMVIDADDLPIALACDGTITSAIGRSNGNLPNYAQVKKTVRGKQVTAWFHRLILQPPDSMTVDHLNHNGLDNRRSNLRTVDKSINCLNRLRANHGTTSGIRGVHLHRASGKWRAQFVRNGHTESLGLFATKEAAGRAHRARLEQVDPLSYPSHDVPAGGAK